MTGIQWTDETWNPVTGCSKISAGCENCYAEAMALRLQRIGQPNYSKGFSVAMHPHMLDIPLRKKRSRKFFVNSMSDLFHQDVPDEFISRIWDVMAQCPQHVFQILTKRADRMSALSFYLPELPNVWLGVSVENASFEDRLWDLEKTRAAVRFASLEPLLEKINCPPMQKLDWAIIGGESGPEARPCDPSWISNLVRDLQSQGVAVYVKQLGSVYAKSAGLKHAKGGDPDEWTQLGLDFPREWPR